MYRIKMLLVNWFICAAAGALMQVVWAGISRNPDNLNPVSLVGMALISGVIGTICLFVFVFVTLSEKSSMKTATIINMTFCFALLWAVYFITGLTVDIWSIDLKWLIILIISETTTVLLTRHWYKRIHLYYTRLEAKKKELRDSADEDSK